MRRYGLSNTALVKRRFAENFSRLNKSYHSPTENKSPVAKYVVQYLQERLGQFTTIATLSASLIAKEIESTKALVIRNMYWGRTSFPKQVFHTSVIVITIAALYTGLGQRISYTQAQEINDTNIGDQMLFDSDIVAQQASLVAFDQINDNNDSVYFIYTVQDGENLEKIAQKYQISPDTLRWANNIPKTQTILRVGQTLKVPKMNGVLYEVKNGDTIDKLFSHLQLNDKETGKVIFLELNSDNLGDNNNLIPGKIVFVPDAKVIESTARGTGENPNVPKPKTTTGQFVNPVQFCNYYASRGYKYGSGPGYGHTGVDLATKPGCKVGAAASGTVIKVGGCGSLGHCVVIKHAGGFSTVVGHGNGVYYVKKGQPVSAGQVVMESGCSGWCKGPHVHLSLAANGQDVFNCYTCRINPLRIIPY